PRCSPLFPYTTLFRSDRDGTMIEDIGYLSRVADIRFYPWTVDAIRALNRADLPVVVVTNQSGIAKGLLTEAVLADVHRAMTDVRSEEHTSELHSLTHI